MLAWPRSLRISALRSRLGRTKSEQQRGPLQYFNSLLKSPVERVPILVPLARETIAWHKTNRLLGLNP
jgi:hypothetical protein